MRSWLPLVLFVAVVAYITMYKPEWHNVLAWKNILLGIVCYCIGELISYYKVIERLEGKKVLVVVLFIVGSCTGLYNGGLSIYGCSYGRSVYLLAAASISISISLMSMFRQGDGCIPEWLSLLGRCSLFIMVSHYFFMHVAVCLISRLGVSNAFSQTVAGLIIVSVYLLYFKLLAVTRLQSKIPDCLGGYIVNRKFERNHLND